MGDEVDFPLQINTKVFYKLIVSLWACLARHAQSTQNNKLTISQGKCEGWTWSFAYRLTSKVSSNCYYHFRCVCPGMHKLPKITSLLFLCNILRKNWVIKLIFCMQVSMKFISTLWASKFPTRLILSLLMGGMIKCFQITQSNKFAIPLQYLKKNRDRFWHADKRQSFYKLVLSFLIEVAIHIQNTQNGKLLIFLQHIRKNVATALCSIEMKNIQIFNRFPVMFVVTCFSQIDVISIIEIQ